MRAHAALLGYRCGRHLVSTSILSLCPPLTIEDMIGPRILKHRPRIDTADVNLVGPAARRERALLAEAVLLFAGASARRQCAANACLCWLTMESASVATLIGKLFPVDGWYSAEKSIFIDVVRGTRV